MNLYTMLGSAVGTAEASSLCTRLAAWHDAMVAHERRLRAARGGDACDDECPHAEAASLWAEALHLAELLDFRPDQGVIRLHEQRVVILSAAALGLLRKELVDTLGSRAARRLLLRFGFADGYHDAVNLRGIELDRSARRHPRRRDAAHARGHRAGGRAAASSTTRRGRFEQAGDVARLVRGRAAPAPLRDQRSAGVLVARRLLERLRERLHGAGDLLPRNAVRGAGGAAAAPRSAATPRAGDLRSRRSGSTSRRPISGTRSSGCARRSARLKELDRRERLLDRRERELNLLRERVAGTRQRNSSSPGSPAMREALEIAARVAPLDTTVLVTARAAPARSSSSA
jgi:hypothetical protein